MSSAGPSSAASLCCAQVDTTFEYKRRGRASHCAIVGSSATVFSEAAKKHARELGVVLLQSSGGLAELTEIIRQYVVQHLDYSRPAGADAEPSAILGELRSIQNSLE